MKKIILIFAMLFSLGAYAQRFTAYQFASKYDYQSKYTAWEPVDIPVTIDIDRMHIVIYSQDPQIIDFVAPEMRKQDGYEYMFAYATDSKYRTIGVELWFMGEYVMILRLRYSNFEYQYQLKS